MAVAQGNTGLNSVFLAQALCFLEFISMYLSFQSSTCPEMMDSKPAVSLGHFLGCEHQDPRSQNAG